MKRNWKAFLAIALVLAMCVTACGNGSDGDTQNAGNDTEVADGGSDSGEEKVLNLLFDTQGATGKNFDYVWWNRGNLYQVLTFRGLFQANPSLTEFKPDLIESYEVSDDNLTYTFVMKDGLKWSDGEDLTAEDVKFSIEAALQVAQINGIYTAAFTKIEGAKDLQEGKADEVSGITVDGNTVTVTLEKPVGNFINVLSQFAILPEHVLADEDPLQLNTSSFWEHPVTNGMYKVDEVVTDSHITLSINENYENEHPKIDKLQVNMVSDALIAAMGGQADFFNTKVPTEIAEMNEQEGWTNFPVDTLFYYYFVMNIQNKDGEVNETFKDPRVREAMLYAIDRESLGASIYPELADVIDAGVPERDDKNFNPDLKKYEYNPEKAKKLLDEAGFDYNQTLEFRYYMADQSAVDLYNAMAQNLADIGVKVNVQKFSGDPTTELFSIRDYDFALKGLSAFGYEEWYGEYVSSSATFPNIIGEEGGKAFDDLYQQLLQENDEDKRAEILKELQATEQEQLLKLPLFMLKNMIYVNTDKVILPDDIEFGNPWYAYDLNFEEWDIK